MDSFHITWSLLAAPGATAARVILLVTLSLASLTDLRARRIPNILTFPVALCAIALHGATYGLTGAVSSLLAAAGWLAAGFLFWAAFRGNGIGAGDVKLATAIAALTGFWPAFWAIFLGNLTQVAYLFLRWIVQGTAFANAKGVFRWGTSLLTPGTNVVHFHPVGMEDKTPHAPFLLIGTILTLSLYRFGALPW